MTITLNVEQAPIPIRPGQVQNKLQCDTAVEQPEVTQQGIRVAQGVSKTLVVIGFVSDDYRMSFADLADYLGKQRSGFGEPTPGPSATIALVGGAICDAHLARSGQLNNYGFDAGRSAMRSRRRTCRSPLANSAVAVR